jgi:hypothetical protein
VITEYVKNLFNMSHQGAWGVTDKLRMGAKYYLAWKHSLERGANPLSDGVPWITFEARDFLDAILTPNALVFEYGSGGSTLFYSARAQKVISVENDAEWSGRVRDTLTNRGVRNCDFRFVPSSKTHNGDGDPMDPQSYASSAEEYSGHSFRQYVVTVDDFPDQFFDFVAIDGRARPSCIQHARAKVKIGGYLMLDNSERPSYQPSVQLLSRWERRQFYGPGPYNAYFWETTFWRRLAV